MDRLILLEKEEKLYLVPWRKGNNLPMKFEKMEAAETLPIRRPLFTFSTEATNPSDYCSEKGLEL